MRAIREEQAEFDRPDVENDGYLRTGHVSSLRPRRPPRLPQGQAGAESVR